MAYVVRLLREGDLFAGFRCGNHKLDAFLKKHAKPNARAKLSSTWVAVDEAGKIVGFVTVVPGAVESQLLKELLPDLPNYPVPVLLLARMGTHEKRRGQGIGRLLLDVVYEAAHEQSNLGCAGVATDAKPDSVGFYAKAGFATVKAPTEERSTTSMFIALSSLPPPRPPPP